MSLLQSVLHEQYESDGDLVLFGCAECDYTSMSLGVLFAWASGAEAVIVGIRLGRRFEWIANHAAWAQSWMDTLEYPLRGDQDS